MKPPQHILSALIMSTHPLEALPHAGGSLDIAFSPWGIFTALAVLVFSFLGLLGSNKLLKPIPSITLKSERRNLEQRVISPDEFHEFPLEKRMPVSHNVAM